MKGQIYPGSKEKCDLVSLKIEQKIIKVAAQFWLGLLLNYQSCLHFTTVDASQTFV